LVNSTANAAADSIRGVVGSDEAHNLPSPVKGKDSRNSPSPTASTGARTASTTITSR
jgi:hypothetical protein